MLDVDFVLHALNTGLNTVPLDPELSNMTPKDFLLGYKAIPVNMAFHDTAKNSIILQKLKESFGKMNEVYRATKLLSPYLWRTKRPGDIRKNIQVNDIVYLRNMDKLGVVIKLAESQLYVLYKDGGGTLRKDWLLNSALNYIATGNSLVKQEIPENALEEMKPIIPEKCKDI